ncbi:unnamed protein product [Linum tenue]|uniref:Anaphase-promoting complex subunit 4-like WD40 domain-containing protein n=1 Tax=Linum tenue TaxID=586396 RepID=A0AAV0LN71_9ROSI|nr:unnamed protein product [Linum tenue]
MLSICWQTSERTLDAPDLVDDFYLNLLDWGSSNVLAIALGSTVYLWDASTGSTSELVTVDEEHGPVTSVNWAPDGRHIAIGLNNSEVQLWDSASNKQLRTLKGGHRCRVGSLAWNDHILTTGARGSHFGSQGARVVSFPVQLACFWRWRRRQDDQVLEHTHRGVLELGRHRIAGLCVAVEQEREGASELSWVHSESADTVEVSVHGEDR